MNILYLLFSFTTGGTERLVADICNEMAKREHTVHLFVVNDLYDQSMLNALSAEVRVYLHNRPVGGGGKINTLLAVARYITENKIDVVHCNSFSAPELLLLKPLCFPRVKILHTIHGLGQYATLGRIKCILRNLLCHRIVAISECVRRDIVKHGADSRKVTTVYNAVDLKRFSPRQRIGDGVIRIGNVARIAPEIKGQDILIQAMKQLHTQYPNLQCCFAGEPDSAHRQAFEEMKSRVQEWGLGDCVHFLGNIEDVPSFLETVDIFVLPSRYEGFGISLVEAMAMGIPCVASRLDGPAEVLGDGTYGTLFTPGDSQDLAQKLDQIIAQLPAYRDKAAETVSYVQKMYDIVGMCDRLEKIMGGI